MRRSLVACLVMVLLAAPRIIPNLSVTPVAPRFESLPGFVGARGRQLVRHDQPFRFVGVNCFELADYADRADDIFGKLSAHHVKVVRFWAFQKHCGPPGRDFTRFETLVAAARRHDVLLLPVLENHWLHCTYDNNEEWKPASWYPDGWRADRYGGAPLTFRDYARAVTGHFRDEPQIMCWQLMNEAERHVTKVRLDFADGGDVSANDDAELRKEVFTHCSRCDAHGGLAGGGTFKGGTQVFVSILDRAC